MTLLFFCSNIHVAVFPEHHLFVLIIFLTYAKASHHKWKRKKGVFSDMSFKDEHQLFFIVAIILIC